MIEATGLRWIVGPLVGLFLLLGCAAASGQTSPPDKIVIATGEYPPFTDSGFKHYGLIPRIVTESFDLVDIDVEYKFYPWARAYELSKDGRVDATAYWYRSPDREQHHFYSDKLMEDTVVWFHLRQTDFDWKTLKDLSGYRLGAVNGYTYTQEFYDLVEAGDLYVEFVPKEFLNYKKLLAGRIDAFPEVIDMGLHVIDKSFPTDTAARFTQHTKPFTRKTTHLIAPRVKPGSKILIEKFNRGLTELRRRGLLKEFLLESREGAYRAPES